MPRLAPAPFALLCLLPALALGQQPKEAHLPSLAPLVEGVKAQRAREGA
jgi:hypothetical protein